MTSLTPDPTIAVQQALRDVCEANRAVGAAVAGNMRDVFPDTTHYQRQIAAVIAEGAMHQSTQYGIGQADHAFVQARVAFLTLASNGEWSKLEQLCTDLSALAHKLAHAEDGGDYA